jgi:taurine transport system permease protein
MPPSPSVDTTQADGAHDGNAYDGPSPADLVREKVSYVAWLLGPFLVFVLIWEAFARFGSFPAYILPAPIDVARAFWVHLGNGSLLKHVTESSIRLILGFIAGAGVAIPLGIAMGMNRNIGRFFDPLVNLFQAIPGLAWVPLAILWFGLGYKAVTFIIFTSVFFPVLFSTLMGVRLVPQTLINAALTMGATRWQVVRSVIVMGALPSLITGLRIGVGYGWRSLVGAEMIAATAGLGFLVFDARQYLRSDVVIMGMLTMGILWVGMDRLILKPLESRTVERWGMMRNG